MKILKELEINRKTDSAQESLYNVRSHDNF